LRHDKSKAKLFGQSKGDIESVILVGGSIRIPKVQDVLSSIVKKELSKNLNADEAMALGAVYQAAYQSKGYKVKKFYVRDLSTYPIVVSFLLFTYFLVCISSVYKKY
jgi:hypoxia up-regulated 1